MHPTLFRSFCLSSHTCPPYQPGSQKDGFIQTIWVFTWKIKYILFQCQQLFIPTISAKNFIILCLPANRKLFCLFKTFREFLKFLKFFKSEKNFQSAERDTVFSGLQRRLTIQHEQYIVQRTSKWYIDPVLSTFHFKITRCYLSHNLWTILVILCSKTRVQYHSTHWAIVPGPSHHAKLRCNSQVPSKRKLLILKKVSR